MIIKSVPFHQIRTRTASEIKKSVQHNPVFLFGSIRSGSDGCCRRFCFTYRPNVPVDAKSNRGWFHCSLMVHKTFIANDQTRGPTTHTTSYEGENCSTRQTRSSMYSTIWLWPAKRNRGKSFGKEVACLVFMNVAVLLGPFWRNFLSAYNSKLCSIKILHVHNPQNK